MSERLDGQTKAAAPLVIAASSPLVSGEPIREPEPPPVVSAVGGPTAPERGARPEALAALRLCRDALAMSMTVDQNYDQRPILEALAAADAVLPESARASLAGEGEEP
jgi:hypothetical protein